LSDLGVTSSGILVSDLPRIETSNQYVPKPFHRSLTGTSIAIDVWSNVPLLLSRN